MPAHSPGDNELWTATRRSLDLESHFHPPVGSVLRVFVMPGRLRPRSSGPGAAALNEPLAQKSTEAQGHSACRSRAHSRAHPCSTASHFLGDWRHCPDRNSQGPPQLLSGPPRRVLRTSGSSCADRASSLLHSTLLPQSRLRAHASVPVYMCREVGGSERGSWGRRQARSPFPRRQSACFNSGQPPVLNR